MPITASFSAPNSVSGTIAVTLGPVELTTLVDYLNKLKTDIQKFTEDDYDDLEDCLNEYIAAAEKRIWTAANGSVGFRKITSGSLVADSVEQSIHPSEYNAIPRQIKVTVAGREYNLLPKAESFINSTASTQVAGIPQFYCVTSKDSSNPKILMSPKPYGAYTYELVYSFADSVITNTTGAWIPRNAYTLLLYATMIDIALFLKYDKETLEEYRNKYMTLLRGFELKHNVQMRISTDRLTADE